MAAVTLGKMLQPAAAGPADVLAPYLRAANIQPDGVLRLSDSKEMWFSDRELGTLSLTLGDVVVVEGGVGGYGRAAYLQYPLDGWGFQNSINRLRPLHDNDGRFLAYYLIALRGSGFIEAYCNIVSMPHLTAEKLAAIPIPVPPESEQRAIADFLDRETAQIDTLIQKQEQLIELLHARSDAEWSRNFGVVSNAWPGVALRRMLDSIVDGPFGSSLTSAHYSDEGARVIRLGNIGINEFRPLDEAYISLDYFQELATHQTQAGDVVIAGLGDERMPLGRAAVMPDLGPAIVKADCYRARPAEGVLPKYVAWALSAPPTRSQFLQLSRGSTRSRLNTSVVVDVRIPWPSLEIQHSVTARWESSMTRSRALIVKAERLIEVAQERRAAQITAAVTGQIDVTAASA